MHPIPLAKGIAVAAGRMERQFACSERTAIVVLCAAKRASKRSWGARLSCVARCQPSGARRGRRGIERPDPGSERSLFDALRDTGAKFSRNLALSCMHDPPLLPLHSRHLFSLSRLLCVAQAPQQSVVTLPSPLENVCHSCLANRAILTFSLNHCDI